MIHYISKKVIDEFDSNLTDWCLGGPRKKGGWTRAGDPVPFRPTVITGYSYEMIDVEEGLAKNRTEVERWHLNFLRGDRQCYYSEYLLPRYNEDKCREKMFYFLDLFEDIKTNGLQKPIWVAKMPWLGFQYFRFNGCHRLCVAKILGIQKISAIVFNTEVL